MKLKVLGSSSKGNSYLLQTGTVTLILDAGIRFRDIQQSLGFDLSQVVGSLVTHEHLDHSKAVRDLVTAGVDVYTSLGTACSIGLDQHHRMHYAHNGIQFELNDFTILPFGIEHDCVEPLGYLIQYRPTGEKLLFATDTYFLRYRFPKLNYILIECNYILEILKANIDAGLIPESLKNRLLESHFSLDNVKGFLKANDLSEVRKLILIHLSDGNSDAGRMVSEIQELTKIETVAAAPGMEIELELYPF